MFIPASQSCFALNEISFSYYFEKKPLKNVFSKITEETGYAFIYDKNLGNKIITINFHNDIIHDVIRKIIQSLENPDNTIIFNEKEKTVEIKIYQKILTDASTISENKLPDLINNEFDRKILPPNNDGVKSIIKRERPLNKEKTSTIDPLDVEIAPPLTQNGKGITRRELLSNTIKTSTIDPLDVEIAPPLTQNGKGITRRELLSDTIKTSTIDTMDIGIIPPLLQEGKGGLPE